MRLVGQLWSVFVKHFKNHIYLYFLCTLFTYIGIITGYMSTGSLSDIQRSELLNYINGFFQLFIDTDVSSSEVFTQSLINNFQIAFIIWILGATFICIPLILIVMGIRGFVFGFTLSFLVNNLQKNGIAFALLSLLPSNIFIIPGLIIMGVISINFSLYIFRNRSSGISNIFKDFIAYTLVMAAVFMIIVIGSLIEGYFSIYLIKVVIS
ncbi:stage II sporulation protein M [Calorimonas adulescens]|uniref:Stage II sporulation protein M n=1 Tax=Calorimonas adulescens TaxID=2606906 RepID=A0A5D8QJG5_9THEO|nr:stage II sporulation protein M [Calorimonas adulescens]